MKRVLSIVLLIFTCILSGCQGQDTSQSIKTLPPIEVWFSPKGGCTEAVVKEIDAAKKTLLVSQVSRSR